jgi:hypothetical protein
MPGAGRGTGFTSQGLNDTPPTLMTSQRSETDPDIDPPRTPRWVKVFGILVGLLAVAFIIMHLTGNSLGSHGPKQ